MGENISICEERTFAHFLIKKTFLHICMTLHLTPSYFSTVYIEKMSSDAFVFSVMRLDVMASGSNTFFEFKRNFFPDGFEDKF